jgi:hypothetical protein
MSYITNKAGITLDGGFKLDSAQPLDVRFVIASGEDKDELLASSCYAGMEVWDSNDSKKYRAVPKTGGGFEWKEVGTMEDIPDITFPDITVTDTGTKPIVGDITASGHTITVSRIGLDDLGLASAYKYKGSKDKYANLPTTGNVTGDVWNVTDTGMNYAWTGTAWDALGSIIDTSNFVTATKNTNVSVAGNTKDTYTYDKTAIFAPNGLIMGGTAAAAGLVTRGVCGVSTPDATTGAATKENLYINYDGNNNWNPNGRGVIINAGTAGTDLGSGMYQYAAVRGDIVKAWVEAKKYLTAESDTLQTVTTRGATTDKSIEVAGLKSTGNISLYAASGATPYLLFQRGTDTDSYNDWGVFGTGGSLYFKNRGSGGAWGNRVTFPQDGGITLDAGNLNVASGSATANSFVNRNSSNDYVLLGGGGTKALSDFAMDSDIPSLNNYVTTNTAQSISGVKTFSTQQKFTVANGTAPFTVTSSTKVSNLNADMVDGFSFTTLGYQYQKSATLSIKRDELVNNNDYIYVKMTCSNKYTSQQLRFKVVPGYDNVAGSTEVTTYSRQQNAFYLDSVYYNGNKFIGIYQPSANTDVYYLKFDKFLGNYASSPNNGSITVYSQDSALTLTLIESGHSEYATVSAYSYIAIPNNGIYTTYLWNSINPRANNTYDLGSNSLKWKNIHGVTIYENGTSLASKYQPLDADLTAIAGLTGTSGFLKKTAADTWTLDTNTYLTAESDTLQTVTTRGATTNKAITTAGLTTTSTLYITGTTGHREGIRIAPYGNLSSIWWNATGTQDYTTGQMWGITAYDKNYTGDTTKTNTFRFRGPTSATATSATDQMWINTSGLVAARGGFEHGGLTTATGKTKDDYVLLAGGGTKLVSEIVEAGSAGVDLSGYVTGSGTANYIPKFTAAGAIGNSEIIDNGSNVYPSANLGNSLGHASYVWDKLFVRQIELNRSQGGTYGRINFYSPAFYTWYEYMSPNGEKSPTSKNTPQYGEVTSWARRSLIENNSGYGWIWEACQNSNTATPVGKMALSSNTGNLTVAGSVTANGFKHSDATTGNNNYVLLAGGGTKAIDDITGTTYGADRGISLSNGNFGHSNTAITAQSTKGLYKISYDAYGHITGTESFTLPNPADYYWANVKVSSTSSTATTPTVQKIGITGSTATDTAAAVTMEYDSSYKALKFSFA